MAEMVGSDNSAITPPAVQRVAVPIVVASENPLVNVDPLADTGPATRTAQQNLLPSAITNRFLSPVQQWPKPIGKNTTVLGDLKLAYTRLGDGVGSNPGSVADFSFKFTGATTDRVTVRLYTSIFIDGLAFINAYPFGSQVLPTNWAMERIPTAHMAPDFSSGNPQYLPLQSNQDSESLIIKYLGSGSHQVFVYYMWRSIANQGGQISPSSYGQ